MFYLYILLYRPSYVLVIASSQSTFWYELNLIKTHKNAIQRVIQTAVYFALYKQVIQTAVYFALYKQVIQTAVYFALYKQVIQTAVYFALYKLFTK